MFFREGVTACVGGPQSCPYHYFPYVLNNIVMVDMSSLVVGVQIMGYNQRRFYFLPLIFHHSK